MYGMNLMGGVGLFSMRHGGGGVASEPAHTLPGGAVADWNAESLALSDGAAVTSWTDSVAGINATGRGTTKPTFVANAMGGKPGVRFQPAQAQDFNAGLPAALTAAFGSREYTVVAVCANIGAAATSIGTVFSSQLSGIDGVLLFADGAKVGRYLFYRDYNGANKLTVFGYTATAKASGLAPVSASPGPYTREFINGSIVACVKGNIPTYKTDGFYIGSLHGNHYANMTMLRMMIWDRPLSPAEILQLQYHLEAHYQQTVARPNKLVVFDGDSITAGANSYTAHQYNYPNIVAQNLNLPLGSWTITAVPGTTSQDMTARASYEVDPIMAVAAKPVINVSFEWYNMSVKGDTTTGPIRAYAAQQKAAGQAILIGSSTSDPNDAGPGDARSLFNASLDSDHSSFDAYVPMHNNPKIGINGASAADANPGPRFYFDGFGIHFTGSASDCGYRQLASEFQTTLGGLL